MKKRSFAVVALLLTAVLLFASCSGVSVLEYKNGTYVNNDTGIAYRHAPINYESQNVNKSKTVAQSGKDDLEGNYLYAIEGADTNQYLTSIHNDLFYADGITLPTLAQMNPGQILFTRTKVLTASLLQINDPEIISDVVSAYGGIGIDEDLIIYEDDTLKYNFRLKFASDAYPMFYYTLDFFGYNKELTVWEPIDDPNQFEIVYPGVEVTVATEGEYTYAVYHFGTDFLYDRATETFYPLGDALESYHTKLDDSLIGMGS